MLRVDAQTNERLRRRSLLRKFMPPAQFAVLDDGMRGEERAYFAGIFAEYGERVDTMPRVYEQDGKGREAVVYLHYFRGGCDWYITERDTSERQEQAFGLADLGHGERELGYISIAELIAHNVELDLHWTPKTIAALESAQVQS